MRWWASASTGFRGGAALHRKGVFFFQILYSSFMSFMSTVPVRLSPSLGSALMTTSLGSVCAEEEGKG